MSTSSTLVRFQPWRLWSIYIVFGLVFVIFVIRLFGLQILDYETYLTYADNNRTRIISDAPQRGIIYDRNGFVLARNVASYAIAITPAYLPDDSSDIQQIYREISDLTGVPVNSGTVEDAKLVSACVPGPGITQLVELGNSLAPYEAVKIQCNVSENSARIARERLVDWPGVSVEVEPIRDYPTGSLTAHVVGFLGPIPARLEAEFKSLGFSTQIDKVGYAGVEASLNDVLIGSPGKRVVEVDVAGQELSNLEPPIAPVPGDNITLTIDTRFQAAAEAAIEEEIDYWNNRYYGYIRISSGAVVAMNPKTGEILAMVSWPSYENNRLARFIPEYYYKQLSEDPTHPLLNAVISAEYPPGSTFKLSTASGALNEGVVSLDQIIEAPGELVITESFSPTDKGFQRSYRDWIYPKSFGKIDFLHCIAYSSNVCFYKLGGGYQNEVPEGLGILRLQQYADAIGYGQPSGIELYGEASGLIPDPAWKRIYQGENWSTGDTYIASVGQGYVLATPLQVLMSAATIANDGKLMQPTIIRSIQDSNGNVLEKWWNPVEQTVSDKPEEQYSYQISPFTPNLKWDVTVDPVIKDFRCQNTYCTTTGDMKVIEPWVIQSVQQGMRLAVTDLSGTLDNTYSFKDYPIAVAGKTGTAEYCDDVANSQGKCKFENWPTHAWTVAYAPFDDPEIVILAFAYNGGEGGSVAAPMVKLVMDAYFEQKALDAAQGTTP
ncbi:MAG: penicillin-binding protein 2 [Chloroflexi bacterium GWB2_49_20]|nr:MAG: penicillin-binding protein 2 [Chloroflexi bacterium GWB2_49_20]OGN79623.1 MAG: penicillin-binding protein 2 [Chloroflexi bacterium GWC2_49_37]OGN84454.1 MAG: penicillin-binding protein 2 [Chloroflexi bacterium GWD2_49_16]HBG74126.1 penicillin-binding protein 2 [Anaerolineae bacterium]HCC78928.1 penicillin-binding protein 2 [Anaerolineae bacterium]